MRLCVLSDLHQGGPEDLLSLLERAGECDKTICLGDVSSLNFPEKQEYFRKRSEYLKALQENRLDGLDPETRRIGAYDRTTLFFRSLPEERKREIVDEMVRDLDRKIRIMREYDVALVYGNWEDAIRREFPEARIEERLSALERYPKPEFLDLEIPLLLIPSPQGTHDKPDWAEEFISAGKRAASLARASGKRFIVVSHAPIEGETFEKRTGHRLASYEARIMRLVRGIVAQAGYENVTCLVHGHLHLDLGDNDYYWEDEHGRLMVRYLPERTGIIFETGKAPVRISLPR